MLLKEQGNLHAPWECDFLLTSRSATDRGSSVLLSFPPRFRLDPCRKIRPRRNFAWVAIFFAISFMALAPAPSAAQASGESKHRIVRVYYPDVTTARRILISFKASVLETNEPGGYHVLNASDVTIDRLSLIHI